MESRDILKESEKTLEVKFNNHVKRLGGWSIKLLPFLVRGLPDRIALLPGGKIVFAEIKTTGEKPRKTQLLVIDKIRKLGFKVFIIDNTESLNECLKYVLTC